MENNTGILTLGELLALALVWFVVICVVAFTQSVYGGWVVDVVALFIAYWLSKVIILKKD